MFYRIAIRRSLVHRNFPLYGIHKTGVDDGSDHIWVEANNPEFAKRAGLDWYKKNVGRHDWTMEDPITMCRLVTDPNKIPSKVVKLYRYDVYYKSETGRTGIVFTVGKDRNDAIKQSIESAQRFFSGYKFTDVRKIKYERVDDNGDDLSEATSER